MNANYALLANISSDPPSPPRKHPFLDNCLGSFR